MTDRIQTRAAGWLTGVTGWLLQTRVAGRRTTGSSCWLTDRLELLDDRLLTSSYSCWLMGYFLSKRNSSGTFLFGRMGPSFTLNILFGKRASAPTLFFFEHWRLLSFGDMTLSLHTGRNSLIVSVWVTPSSPYPWDTQWHTHTNNSLHLSPDTQHLHQKSASSVHRLF